MINCNDTKPVIGCFIPSNGSPSVPIIIHIIYDKDEKAIGQVYTTGDDNETPLDITTYLGGGTVTSGNCTSPTIFEKEVCVTVDGSTDSYEVFKVYTRDAVTELPILLHYETKQGVVITGDVVEVCCTCNSLCDYGPNACSYFSAATGTTPCASIRLDATPGGLSNTTLQSAFTGQLLSSPGGSPICPSVIPDLPFSTANAGVINSNGGTTIAVFADLINATWGAYGFSAGYCEGERVSITGPSGIGDWVIRIGASNGDTHELIWDDTNAEFSKNEINNGTLVTVLPGDTVMANGLHPAESCSGCDTP